MSTRAPITRVQTRVYRIPTDAPESDGTFEWSSTTMVLVQTSAGGQVGIGFTYSAASAASLIDELLAPTLADAPARTIPLGSAIPT